MLIPFSQCVDLLKKNGISIGGILHIGAHLCEEHDAYAQRGINNVVWVEGNRSIVERVKREQKRNIYHALIDIIERDVEFHIANNGQSSSILEFGTHKIHHSYVHYVGSTRERTTTLKSFIDTNKIDIPQLNFWNLDIQGVELRALRSAGDYLRHADAIYTEVNSEEVYQGCDLIQDLDAFLSTHGFSRVLTQFAENYGWGDALYIRDPRNKALVVSPGNQWGRLGNHFFRNFAAHCVAQQQGMVVKYSDDLTSFGFSLYQKDGDISLEEPKILTENDAIRYATQDVSPRTSVTLDHIYCQTSYFARKLLEYVQANKNAVKESNPFKDRFGTNDDTFVHVRLGDAEQFNPGLHYYEKALEGCKGGYISSDSPSHMMVKHLMETYNLTLYTESERTTVQFASTCKNIVLSSGTFSWMIGVLAVESSIAYPEIKRVWHGPIFECTPWNRIKYT